MSPPPAGDEKGTNLVELTRPVPASQLSSNSVDVQQQQQQPTAEVDSARSITATTVSRTEKSLDEREASPFSPFYNPAPTRTSLEERRSSKANINIVTLSTSKNSYETDLETGLEQLKATRSGGGSNLLKENQRRSTSQDCTVWPGRAALKKKKKEMKRQEKRKGVCGCMAGLSKRTKIWVKILILCVVVGVVTGVGIGISKAVGGGVWKNGSHNAPISSR